MPTKQGLYTDLQAMRVWKSNAEMGSVSKYSLFHLRRRGFKMGHMEYNEAVSDKLVLRLENVVLQLTAYGPSPVSHQT